MTSTSPAGSANKERSDPMMRSNVGSAASLEDLANLPDDVYFGSCSSAYSGRTPRTTCSKDIIDNGRDDVDNADSGNMKVNSYSNFCTNQFYSACPHVCMVNITQVEGEVEDACDDDEYGNSRLDPTRIDSDVAYSSVPK
jgi:hypothetical protein